MLRRQSRQFSRHLPHCWPCKGGLVAHRLSRRPALCLLLDKLLRCKRFEHSFVRSGAELKESGNAQTKLLLSNPYRSDLCYYYIGLKGISIGETLPLIPPSTFEINQDGSGGLFIDTGTSMTHLVEPAYSTIRQAVFDLVRLPRADIPCFRSLFRVALFKSVVGFAGHDTSL